MLFGIAAICYPYGQRIGHLVDGFDRKLVAYSLNITGSLLGIAAFSLFSCVQTRPILWFGLVFLLSLPLLPRRNRIIRCRP